MNDEIRFKLRTLDLQPGQLVYEPKSIQEYWACRSCGERISHSSGSEGTRLLSISTSHKESCPIEDKYDIRNYAFHITPRDVQNAKENVHYRTIDLAVIQKLLPELL